MCHIWKPHFIKTVFSIYLCKLFAISVLYAFRNFDFLIPDAPELIANFLDGEQDASCKRNAFMMLIHADQVTLVHACWNLMVLCNFFIINYCVLSWLKAMTVFMLSLEIYCWFVNLALCLNECRIEHLTIWVTASTRCTRLVTFCNWSSLNLSTRFVDCNFFHVVCDLSWLHDCCRGCFVSH